MLSRAGWLRGLLLVTLGVVAASGAETLARWDGWPGPVAGELKIPATAAGDLPLVTAGPAESRDVIAMRVTAPGRVRFSFSHAGRRIVESAEVELAVSKSHRLVVSMGSMLPPLRSGIYWAQPYLLHLASELLVMVDGRVVLAQPAEFASGLATQFAFNDQAFAGVSPAVLSEVAAVVLPLMGSGVVRDAAWRGFPGPVRLVVRPDAGAAHVSQPLLSTGRLGAGDLIYWTVQPDGRVKIGWAHAGAAPIESEPLPMREGAQEILIAADSLLPPNDDELARREPELARLRGRFFVELNGRVALALRAKSHPSRAENIVFGANVVESQPVRRYFEGAGESIGALSPADVLAASARVVGRTGTPSDAWEGWPGPVRLRVKFPTDRTGVAEPLLCSGKTGAADLIYVRYVDARHVQIAFDHWGVGGPTSDPIEFDPEATQEIVVSYGALFPPAGSALFVQQPALAARRDEVRLTLNGRPVLVAAARSHASVPDGIVFGLNPVGASSCVPEFSGELIELHAAPEALAVGGK